MKSSYLRGLNMASFFCASKVIVFITFTLYVLLGNTISASRVFVTVSLYSAVRLTVTLFFPNAIEKLFESRVSIRRIQVRCFPIFISVVVQQWKLEQCVLFFNLKMNEKTHHPKCIFLLKMEEKFLVKFQYYESIFIKLHSQQWYQQMLKNMLLFIKVGGVKMEVGRPCSHLDLKWTGHSFNTCLRLIVNNCYFMQLTERHPSVEWPVRSCLSSALRSRICAQLK